MAGVDFRWDHASVGKIRDRNTSGFVAKDVTREDHLGKHVSVHQQSRHGSFYYPYNDLYNE